MLSSSLTDFLSLAQRLMSTDQRLWELVKGRDGGEWAGKWNKEVERFLGDKKVKEYFEVVWRIGGNVPTELRSILVSHTLNPFSKVLATDSCIPNYRRISSLDSTTSSVTPPFRLKQFLVSSTRILRFENRISLATLPSRVRSALYSLLLR